ncbi:MAG: ATP-binding protein [Neisseriaceae bacterium]
MKNFISENQTFLVSILQNIMNYMPIHLYWKDKNGVYLGCNDLQAADLGFEQGNDILGKTDFDLSWPVDAAKSFRENDIKVMSTQRALIFEEISIFNGSPCAVLSYKIPLVVNNESVGIIGFSIDISAQKEKTALELENHVHVIRAMEDEKFRNLIGQMIHDIQQPLASLQMVINSTKEIPEEKRIVLRDSNIAIIDITNQLLVQYNPDKALNKITERQITLVSPILSDLIGEKRQKYKKLSIKFVYDINALNAFICIKVNITDFKRALTNIINNSIESLPKSAGIIEVRLTANDEWVTITILDNGKGIPNKILEKINNKEALTYGKKEGHGLGLGQVRSMLEANYGEFFILSSTDKIGHGTTAVLRFPKVIIPDWLIEKIELNKNDIVIILDDDKNIHNGWNSRLEYILQKIPSIKIKHFSSGLDVINFINNLSDKEKQHILFLCDYELIYQKLNGLEVILELKIKRSILVTSHYSNTELRKKAVQNRVRILPKNLVHVIPIQVIQSLKKCELINAHMVFVDDEKIFTNTLISRYYNHLVTAQYSNPLEFLDEIDRYPKDTRIILDNYFYMPDGGVYNIDGITLAAQLYEKGFNNLVLLTGEKFKVPDYLKLVLKIDQDGLSTLDKI